MRFAMVLSLGMAVLLAAPQFARADDTPEWKTCISPTNTGAERLPACSAVIDAKSVTGRKLAGAYCIRGNDRTEKGELDAALADLNEAISIDATYACAYVNRGRVYGFKGDYDRAIAEYDTAIKLDARMALAYNNRGDAWLQKKEFDRAIADLNEAIRLNPTFAKSLGNRGDAHYGKRDYARAIEDYSTEIRISPSTEAYLNRGESYRESEQLDRAASDLIRLFKGDNKGARADYDKALLYDPTDAASWNNRGQAKVRSGDRKGAIADFKKALELRPDNANARAALAKLGAAR